MIEKINFLPLLETLTGHIPKDDLLDKMITDITTKVNEIIDIVNALTMTKELAQPLIPTLEQPADVARSEAPKFGDYKDPFGSDKK